MKAVVSALLAAAAMSAGACAKDRPAAAPAADAEARVAQQVLDTYRSPEAVAAAVYTWTAPAGLVFALVDVESGLPGVLQARADLWMAGDSAPVRLARSDVMPSAATIGVFAFEDVTGDGLPDLLGYVADSAGTAYPVFLVGARGMMAEQLEMAAPGYRLSAEPEEAPHVVTGPGGPCALALWADAPVPDSWPPGWRYLALRPAGDLAAPAAAPPACP